MTVAKQVDIRANIKKFFDLAFSGEPVIVPRKENRNVVIISESEYKELEKARRNTAFISRILQGHEDIENGRGIIKSMDELRAMERE